MSNRKLERIELNQTIIIMDTISGERFGELVNVTTEGLMVMTDREIATHGIFQLRLELPVPINNSKQLSLGADCLWCRQAENLNRYWAGFHIIDISDAALLQLEELIGHYQKSA